MPKETIVDHLKFSNVQIRWGRDDGLVQIGVELQNGSFKLDDEECKGIWSMPSRTLYVTVTRADERTECPVCLFDAVETLTIAILFDSGVSERIRTFCGRCKAEERRADV